MNPIYTLQNPDSILTPSLLFYKELIQQNIQQAIRMVGSPARLRPHVKTHKCREIARMQLQAGVTKHKVATLAEAEMLAMENVPNVLISYPMVGPNQDRLAKLMKKYPQTHFSSLIDHTKSAKCLSEKMNQAGLKHDVVLDLNVGMNRTGIIPGEPAIQLYELATQLPGLHPIGFQVYDGHNHQESASDRQASVDQLLGTVLAMRAVLEQKGISVPTIICGGTPTFPIFAKMDIPGLECSPGTYVLHDSGYGAKFADLAGFTPAAVLLSRIISKPTANRLTMDLGSKSLASDPPAGKRCVLLNIPNYTFVMQSEEHLVVETPQADDFEPGDIVYAIPTHICPTCSIHQRAYVVEQGEVVDTWNIAARDRVLTI